MLSVIFLKHCNIFCLITHAEMYKSIYHFFDKPYYTIIIGLFAFYTAILAFLYPQVVLTKSKLKERSSEYLLNKFKEDKLVKNFLILTVISLIACLLLIIIKIPILLPILVIFTGIETYCLYYKALQTIEKFSFEKEEILKEDFCSLNYENITKDVSFMYDEYKDDTTCYLTDITDKVPCFNSYIRLLSACETEICNNLTKFEQNYKILDLIIKNFHDWIKYFKDKKIAEETSDKNKRLIATVFALPLQRLIDIIHQIIVDENNEYMISPYFEYITKKLKYNPESEGKFTKDNKECYVFPYSKPMLRDQCQFSWYVDKMFELLINSDDGKNNCIGIALNYCGIWNDRDIKNFNQAYCDIGRFLLNITKKIYKKDNSEVGVKNMLDTLERLYLDKLYNMARIRDERAFSEEKYQQAVYEEQCQEIINYRVIIDLIRPTTIQGNKYTIFNKLNSSGLCRTNLRSDIILYFVYHNFYPLSFVDTIIAYFFICTKYGNINNDPKEIKRIVNETVKQCCQHKWLALAKGKVQDVVKDIQDDGKKQEHYKGIRAKIDRVLSEKETERLNLWLGENITKHAIEHKEEYKDYIVDILNLIYESVEEFCKKEQEQQIKDINRELDLIIKVLESLIKKNTNK